MAAENLTWHIGNTAQRIQDAGYGDDVKVWATENFAMSWGPYTLAQIQQEWADDTHMIPMRKAVYCNIGAGVATAADGTVYYIVHAAYTSAGTCASYQSPTSTSPQQAVAEINEVLTVDLENTLPYTVDSGDSLWSIAIAHDTSIAVIKQLNNLTTDDIYVGQNLKLPAPPLTEPIPTQTHTLPPKPTSTLQVSASPTIDAINASPTAPQPSPTPTSTPTTLAATVSMNNPAPPSKNSALLWQIISGLEFAALTAGVLFFWKPWTLHHRFPET
jgi:LysM repeat protein